MSIKRIAAKVQREIFVLGLLFSVFSACKPRETAEVKDAQTLTSYFWKDQTYAYRGECTRGQLPSKECRKNLSLLPLSNLKSVRETLTQSINDYEYLQTTENAALFKQYVEQNNDDQKHLLLVLDTLEDPKKLFIATTKLERDFLDSIFDRRAFIPVKSVSAGGSHTCVILHTDELRCWGLGKDGRLGLGDEKNQEDANSVKPVLHDVSHVALGETHSCAIQSQGVLRCWGSGFDEQLGLGDTKDQIDASKVMPVLTGVNQVALGYYHTCAILKSGDLKCWGTGVSGQLGLGDRYSQPKAEGVRSVLQEIVQVKLGRFHTCAINRRGELKCWGAGSSGNLDLNDRNFENSATSASVILPNVNQISLGEFHTCAILKTNKLRCSGGISGDLRLRFNQRQTDANKDGSILSEVSQVALGKYNTCAVHKSGKLRCWGEGGYGQLGLGGERGQDDPTKVGTILSDVKEVAVGDAHICAILKIGAIKCWGSNNEGQLGNPALKKFGENYGDEPGETLDKLPALFFIWKKP